MFIKNNCCNINNLYLIYIFLYILKKTIIIIICKNTFIYLLKTTIKMISGDLDRENTYKIIKLLHNLNITDSKS